jgi:hypothetical protein
MFGFLTNIYDYYYIVLILQGICAFHSIRRGTQSKWIWIIVFLPLIGSIAYIFTEIVKKQDVASVQSNVSTIINPTGRIKTLEKNLKFSNTFTNRTALADAYVGNRQFDKAIELYEPDLSGLHHDNQPMIKNLIQCYHHFERWDDIVKIAPRISKNMDFSKTIANLYYAYALEKTGKLKEAEEEYKKMMHRFSNFEQRYAYGDFLLRMQKKEDAALVFHEIMEESQHMSRAEKGNSKQWMDKAEKEWKRIMSEVSTS